MQIVVKRIIYAYKSRVNGTRWCYLVVLTSGIYWNSGSSIIAHKCGIKLLMQRQKALPELLKVALRYTLISELQHFLFFWCHLHIYCHTYIGLSSAPAKTNSNWMASMKVASETVEGVNCAKHNFSTDDTSILADILCLTIIVLCCRIYGVCKGGRNCMARCSSILRVHCIVFM